MIGIGIPTTKNKGVDEKGGITGHDYSIQPLKDANETYFFQKVSSPVTINSLPVSTTACQAGTSATFSVGVETLDNPSFTWQIYNLDSTNFEPWDNLINSDAYSGTNTATLKVNNVNVEMDGDKFRVLVNSDQYLCPTNSDEVSLTVFEKLPVANSVSSIVICDDNSVGDDKDGIVSSFNLASQTATILGNQSAQDFTVTYHISQSDADDISSNGLSSPYTNTIAGGEKIYVRVLNDSSGCYRATTSFDVTVAPLPVVKKLITVEQCDDDEINDGKSLFNLTKNETLISSDFANEKFEYYTAADFNVDSLIADPTNFRTILSTIRFM